MTEVPPGFTARPVLPERDVAAILDLATSAAVAEYGVSDVDERIVREAYAMPSFDPSTDSWLVLDAGGRAVGLAEFYDTEEIHVAPYVFTRIHPDLLESPIPDAVLAWAVARAPRNLGLAPDGSRVAIHTDVASVNGPMIEALRRNGWRRTRTQWVMEIDLAAAAPIPEPAWPAGIGVRTADLEGDARPLHTAVMDAFGDHYGFVPEPFEAWWHVRTAFWEPEPQLWFIATQGEEIAGMALCASRRPGQPDLGWVSSLGVRRPFRRRGLALALLRHAFRELAARGVPRVGLGVDAESLTGATRLYEKAGMRPVREFYEYERLIRGGMDLRTLTLDLSGTSPDASREPGVTAGSAIDR